MARSNDEGAILLAALAELAGPALVLDGKLRIVAASPGAEGLVGVPIPTGVPAVKLLCGGAVVRPLAEALAARRPAVTVIPRPRAGGPGALRVRALPIGRDAAAGWLILLEGERETDGDVVDFQGMLTRDPGMKRMFQIVRKVAPRDVRVLVRGETGAGKELVAHAIHALSPRAKGPFRVLNCAALPSSLLESELFGHVRGAFTGAVRDYPGHFRLAHGGTLFLDEIGEMPPELQSKLLRVVETGTVIPVGGVDAVDVDVRIVAATHRSLRAETVAGRFRADLMYRLRVVPIFLPPLRARAGDVMLLAERFVAELNQQGERRVERIAPDARARLEAYPWPGNVRELRNAIEYAFVIGEGPVLASSDLPPEILEPRAPPAETAVAVNIPPPLPAPPSPSPEAERIQRALERAGGNRDRAARILGISRATLWRRIRALGLGA
jgi:transcriptional regulator with PAS, ATPase and Fis domain